MRVIFKKQDCPPGSIMEDHAWPESSLRQMIKKLLQEHAVQLGDDVCMMTVVLDVSYSTIKPLEFSKPKPAN